MRGWGADATRAFEIAYVALGALLDPGDAALAEQVKQMQRAAFGVEARGNGREIHELAVYVEAARRIDATRDDDAPARAVAKLRGYIASAHPNRAHRVEDATLRTAIDGMHHGGKLSGAVHAVFLALGLAHSLATVSKAIRKREKKHSTPK